MGVGDSEKSNLQSTRTWLSGYDYFSSEHQSGQLCGEEIIFYI